MYKSILLYEHAALQCRYLSSIYGGAAWSRVLPGCVMAQFLLSVVQEHVFPPFYACHSKQSPEKSPF